MRPMRTFPWILVGLLLCSATQSVADFVNGSFEDDFDGWTLEFSTYLANGNYTPWTTDQGSHPIPSTLPTIEFGTVNLPALCDSFTAKINNRFGQKHATRISQTTTLSASDIGDAPCNLTSLRVTWIAALVEPDHDTGEQPHFQIVVKHNNNTIESLFVTADGAADDDWLDGGNMGDNTIWYKVNTFAHTFYATAGDQVSISMLVSDCSWGSHGGMAFIDCAEISPFEEGPIFAGDGVWTLEESEDLGWIVGDYNGDGLDDVLRYTQVGASIEVLLSDGTSFGVPTEWLIANSFLGLWVGDFDGDGLDDLARHVSGDGFQVMRSTGTSFETPVTWTTAGWGSDQTWYIGDFDGDGRDDIARNMFSVHEFQVLLSTGSSFSSPEEWMGQTSSFYKYWVGDFNGDCKDDLMFRLTHSPFTQVWESTGSEFAGPSLWNPNIPWENDEMFRVGDFNGDTLDDIAYIDASGVITTVRVYRSIGSHFATSGVWMITPTANNETLHAGNFAATDAAEIIRDRGNSTFGSVSCNSAEKKECFDCVEVVVDSVWCAQNAASPLTYEFELSNHSGVHLIHVTLYPPNGVTFSPSSFVVDLADGASTTLQTLINLGSNAPSELCFTLAVHDEEFDECCSSSHCTSIARPIPGCPLVDSGTLGWDGVITAGNDDGPYGDQIGGVTCALGPFSPADLGRIHFTHNQEVDPELNPQVSNVEDPRFDLAASSPALFSNGATILDCRQQDPWFVDANHAGAVGFTNGEDENDWTTDWTYYDYSGGASRTDIDPLQASIPVSGAITIDTAWTNDLHYELLDRVVVMPGVTLSIDPGTFIFGHPGSMLVVEPGAQIAAPGTQDQPIVFTSVGFLLGVPQQPGDWGGLLIKGNAIANCFDGALCAGTDSGPCNPSPEVGTYGGADDTDSSGLLQYCRVEYAGGAVGASPGLHACSFWAVGRRTTIEFVQVHQSATGGFEWIGGSARARWLVTTGCAGNGMTWRDGFRGRVQFAVVQQVLADPDADAIEGNNNESDFDCEYRSDPILANLTLVGPEVVPSGQHGVLLQRGTGASIFNSIVTGASGNGLAIEDESTFANCPGLQLTPLDLAPDPADANISDIRAGAFAVGTSVQVKSVVVTAISPGSQDPTDSVRRGFWVQEETSSENSGIWCRFECIPDLEPGHCVDVDGIYLEIDGIATLDLSEGSFSDLGAGTMPTPAEVSFIELMDGSATAENWESVLVRVTGTGAGLDVLTHVGQSDYEIEDSNIPGATLRVSNRSLSSPARVPIGSSLDRVSGIFGISAAADQALSIHPRDHNDLEWITAEPAPSLKLASNPGDEIVRVIFDRPVDETSAENIANYSFPAGTTVTWAALLTEDTVVLVVDPPPPTADPLPLELTVVDVENLDGAPMLSEQISFIGGINNVAFVQTAAAGGVESQVADEITTVTGIVVADNSADFLREGATRYYLALAEGGPLSGLSITSLQCSDQVRRGDELELTGRVVESEGRTELREIATMEQRSAGNSLPEAELLSLATLADPLLAELWEGVLVRLENVTAASDTSGGATEWTVTAGTGDTLLIGTLGNYQYVPQIDDEFVFLQGMLDYRSDRFVLEPRQDDDVGAATSSSDGDVVKRGTHLYNAFPNPFRPQAAIAFDLEVSSSQVRLAIYDARGRLVRTLLDDSSLDAGHHVLAWDGRADRGSPRAAAGVYFVHLAVGKTRATRKVVLLK